MGGGIVVPQLPTIPPHARQTHLCSAVERGKPHVVDRSTKQRNEMPITTGSGTAANGPPHWFRLASSFGAIALGVGASIVDTNPAHAMREGDARLQLAFVPAIAARGASVPAGRTTTLGFLVGYDPSNCQVPPIRVSRAAAQNGRVGSTDASRRLTPGQIGARGRKCAGTLMRGTAITYTPAPGYRGADRVTVNVTYGNGAARRSGGRSFRFTVR